ncbi:hypothetical protein SAMN04487948_10553 [Halogranum amylolyticum]|uniref:Uncharacterized protein n=1 Tax=Halogranum amylolyticum TaxID=660520 RepID=A0A1H8SFG2_9EURY|nr:DUF5794 domain-containing protein [Halogranum amylolyticum]SEO77421.1 hypothetical protein SAMN04487948_10553 [Halogranum amylolyticum]
MSVSQHPVALRLEQQVGGATKLLATVMGLPLVDGILPALIVAGALQTPTDIVETGLLVFGGSATMAVILAEMEGTRREQVLSILLLAAILLPVAALEAMFAQTLANVLDLDTFQRFAGIVILAIAAKTASSKVGEYLPSPGAIIGLGLVASFDPSGGGLELTPEMATVFPAVAAVGVGLAFALTVALLAPRLRGVVDIDLFRFGSSVALGMLALSVLGVPGIPSDAPIALVTLGVTAVFALDPNSGSTLEASESVDADAAVPDGGDDENEASDVDADETDPAVDDVPDPTTAESDDSDSGYGYPGEDEARAPWL